MFKPAFISTLAVALAATAASLPAHAQDAPRTVTVSWSDLDMASSAGRAELQRRVRSAANRVCSENGVKGAAAASRAQECRAVAIANAQTQLAARGPAIQVASR